MHSSALPALPSDGDADDDRRVAALRRLRILDTVPERIYDDLAVLASQICGTPIALLSLVDKERQWFKARVGLEAQQTHRDLAFCSHAILAPEALFVVKDTLLDNRFRNNALVTGAPHIRFYAGAPVVTRDGAAVGTVCVIDAVPRELTLAQGQALQALARQAAVLLEMHERAAEAEEAKRALDDEFARRRQRLTRSADAVVVLDADFAIVEASDSFASMLGYGMVEVMRMKPWDWDARHDSSEKVMARFQNYAAESESFETVWQRKDGTQLEVEVSYSRVAAEKGSHAFFVCRDVTERNRTARALRQATDLLEQMGSLAQVGGWELDLVSNTITWTAEVYRIHEVDRSTPLELARNIEFYAPAARPIIAAAVNAAIEQGTPYDLELPFVTGKGNQRWVRAQGIAEHQDGKAIRLFGAFQDITERKRIEQAIVDSEHRLQMIADNLPALVTYIDRHERYGFVNAHVGRIFGISPESMLGRTVREIRGEKIYADLAPHVASALAGESVSFQNSGEAQGQTYHYQSNYTPDCDAEGEVQGFYAMTFDITALKETQRRLDDMARTDPLTRLANRRQFEERLREAISRSLRLEEPLAVMFLDVDNFKAVNDEHGHAGGDKVLIEFATRLTACVRLTDLVARLAGDEFVLLLGNFSDELHLARFAQKVMQALRAPCVVGDRSIVVTASAGLALYERASTAAELLHTADRALYESKRKGRDRFSIA